MKVRIKAKYDTVIGYLYKDRKGDLVCRRSEGMQVPSSYLGIDGDEMAFRFQFEDAVSPEEALLVCRAYGAKGWTFEIWKPKEGIDPGSAHS